jgi:beta-glucanase (GH16 family)
MSRYWIAACAALIAVLGGLMPLAESASATPAPEVKPSACGPDRFVKADGSRYECSFVDNFSGTELDDEKWMVQVSSNLSGFSPGRTCFLDSPNNVFVRDGHLNLVGRVGDLPTRCKTPYRLFFSKYTGGAVVTWDRFSQTYGRFSFRAKYPGTDEAGYNSNIWMSPQKLTYGRWPRSGEIDIAEYWSGHPDMVHPSLHYTGHSRADTAWDCKVSNVGDFHIYTLEWTPTEMRFFYDDTLCFKRSWKPWMHPRDGRPFNHPFGLVMSQGIWDPYFPVSKELPKSGTMQVDWVRVWR